VERRITFHALRLSFGVLTLPDTPPGKCQSIWTPHFDEKFIIAGSSKYHRALLAYKQFGIVLKESSVAQYATGPARTKPQANERNTEIRREGTEIRRENNHAESSAYLCESSAHLCVKVSRPSDQNSTV
jgi:hypothetical protein